MKPQIELEDWPVAVVRWPTEMTLEEIDQHFQEMLELARREVVFGVVIDMSKSGMPAAVFRHRAAQHLRVVYEAAGSRVAGVAHVITSPLVRGLMTAVYWISPPPFTTVIVKSCHEASAWVRRRIRANVEPPTTASHQPLD